MDKEREKFDKLLEYGNRLLEEITMADENKSRELKAAKEACKLAEEAVRQAKDEMRDMKCGLNELLSRH